MSSWFRREKDNPVEARRIAMEDEYLENARDIESVAGIVAFILFVFVSIICAAIFLTWSLIK